MIRNPQLTAKEDVQQDLVAAATAVSVSTVRQLLNTERVNSKTIYPKAQ